MKIVHLSSAHPANDIRIYHKMAVSAAAAGHAVVVIARPAPMPESSAVRVVFVPAAAGRLSRMTSLQAALFDLALAEDADIYHFHDPEVIPVAALLGFHGKKVVYDVHEDMPRNILSKPWIPRFLRPSVAGATGLLEKLAGAVVDGIIAATPAIASRFPPSKTIVVRNFPLFGEFAKAPPLFASRSPQALYIGAISRVRGLAELIEAARMLSDIPGFEMVLAGPLHPPSLLAEIEASYAWEKGVLSYKGVLSRSGVAEAMSGARVGLMPGHDVQSMQESYPIKIFEYMASGLPQVLSDFPLWRSLAPPSVAVHVVPGDAAALASAVRGLLLDGDRSRLMGEEARRLAFASYDWAVEARAMLEFYAQVVARH